MLGMKHMANPMWADGSVGGGGVRMAYTLIELAAY